MTLVIDIGNSYCKFIYFDNDKIIEDSFLRFKTKEINKNDILDVIKKDVRDIIISSVVKEATDYIVNILKTITNIEPLILKEQIDVSIKTNIKEPESIGADLLADIIGSYKITSKSRLIIDVGTVTKLLLINDEGVFVGANFVPGLEASANALSRDTSALPKTILKYPDHVLGIDTNDAINTGIMCGNKFMLDGFISFYKRKYPGIIVIFTGGGSEFIASAFNDAIFDKYLTLKGIYRCYKERNKNEL